MRFALVLLIGCGAAPAAGPTTRASVERLELREGVTSTLRDGTTVGIKDVGYVHLPDSRNLSTCTLLVKRGEAYDELVLAREHGGADPESAAAALGWQFTLEVADPYRRPARAVVLAQPLDHTSASLRDAARLGRAEACDR